MKIPDINSLSALQISELFEGLEERFTKNMHRHKGVTWSEIQAKLEAQPEKIWSLYQMEETGGEPDVVILDAQARKYAFYDCATETPKGRRSLCYDPAALASRKEHKPKHSAVGVAEEMGVALLTEEEYRALQKLEAFDLKTSSWLQTPAEIRKRGGAIFGDCRYDQVFIYHNGAESYYAARGFRAVLHIS